MGILTTLGGHRVLGVNSRSPQACVSQLLLAVGSKSGRPELADTVASRRARERLSRAEDPGSVLSTPRAAHYHL